MEEHSQMWFLGFYALLTVVSLVVTISLRMVFAKASVRAARVVHEVRATCVCLRVGWGRVWGGL